MTWNHHKNAYKVTYWGSRGVFFPQTSVQLEVFLQPEELPPAGHQKERSFKALWLHVSDLGAMSVFYTVFANTKYFFQRIKFWCRISVSVASAKLMWKEEQWSDPTAIIHF